MVKSGCKFGAQVLHKKTVRVTVKARSSVAELRIITSVRMHCSMDAGMTENHHEHELAVNSPHTHCIATGAQWACKVSLEFCLTKKAKVTVMPTANGANIQRHHVA